MTAINIWKATNRTVWQEVYEKYSRFIVASLEIFVARKKIRF